MRLIAAICLATPIFVMLGLAAGPAQAQQPTAAQTSAIRSNCRSDFMANCSGVTPGGKDALDCLTRNRAKLSGPCSTAVSAIASAPPAGASAPTQNPAPVAPAATQTPPAAAAAKPSPAKKPAGAPAAKLNPPPLAPPVPPAAAPTVAPLTPRPFIMPERRLAILEICKADARSFCAGTPPGGGRLIDCLAANAGILSPACYDAIARVSH
jgi:hypothetical protein